MSKEKLQFRPESRKQKIYELWCKDPATAFTAGKRAQLMESTLHSWFSAWTRATKGSSSKPKAVANKVASKPKAKKSAPKAKPKSKPAPAKAEPVKAESAAPVAA
jgi:hypothetical protein